MESFSGTVLRDMKLVENGKNRVVKTVLTDDTGKYTFSEVPNGEYSVMFEFEDKKYSPTVYKKNNVEDSKVSDAIGVNRQETTKQVAVSLGKNGVFKKHKTSTPASLVVLKGEIKFIINDQEIILKQREVDSRCGI